MKNDRYYNLRYGESEIQAHLDRGRTPRVLVPRSQTPAQDASGIVRRALSRPIDSPPLREIVSAGEKVTVVASDTTRTTASSVFIPIVIEELNSAGIADKDINIVVALGIHRRQTDEEHRYLLGDHIYRRIRPIDHDARDNSAHVSYGSTSRGTKVSVNRMVAQADRIVLTGAVSPHYFAGFGGGRKSIMPGVCALEANLQSHLLVFNPPPGQGRNPDVRIARLNGNPVHEDMIEAAKMVNPDFMLNTIVTPEKQVVAAFAGHCISAHEAACAYYLDNFSVVVPEQVDLTVVSTGGYPKDINFIQSHKAIHTAYSATKPGGWMIVLAECRDGFGYPGFLDWFKFDNASDFEKGLRADYEIYGQTAYATFEKSTTVNILLVSALEPSDVERMKIRPVDSFEQAYTIATQNLANDFETCVIPSASSTLLLTRRDYEGALASIAGASADE